MNMRTNQMKRFFATFAVPVLVLVYGGILSQTTSANSVPSDQHEREVGDGSVVLHLPSGDVLQINSTGLRFIQNGTDALLSPNGRTFSSATITPSGRVLIWGGFEYAGNISNEGLWFDPNTQSLVVASDVPFEARAGHSISVLTDGQLVLLGGRSGETATPSYAQVWNPRTGLLRNVATTIAEFGAVTSLRADGDLEIRDQQGTRTARVKNDAIDVDLAANESDEARFRIAQSIPSEGSTSFSADGTISLRFSRLVSSSALSADTVTLLGPNGPSKISVVAAEGGRLAFVVPQRELLPASRYTLFLSNLQEVSGSSSGLLSISFMTALKRASISSSTHSDSLQHVGPGATNIGSTTGKEPGSAVQIHKMTGEASSAQFTKCNSTNQRHGYRFCGDEGSIAGGVFTPGFNNTDGRWRTNVPEPKLLSVASVPADRIRVGTTSLFGTVRRIDDVAVGRVTVSIGDRSSTTDDKGVFVLNDVPAGHQVMFVDGSSANIGSMEYGQFPVAVDLQENKANAMPFNLYLPRITARDKVRINSPSTVETVITHPAVPGLEIHIPAGAVFRDHNGKVLTEISIVPMPVDRSPTRIPENFPVYVDLQPGGATLDGLTEAAASGVRFVYPNYLEQSNSGGELWYYDAEGSGWSVYSSAHLSNDKKTLVQSSPISGPKLMPQSFIVSGTGGGKGKPKCGLGYSGDPVDCGSGVFFYKPTDLAMFDPTAVDFQRLYNSTDTTVRAFGVGMSDNFGMYLYSQQGRGGCADAAGITEISVIDGDGIEYPFYLVPSDGAGSNAESHSSYLIHNASPSRFYGARLQYSAASPGYIGVGPMSVMLRDGTQYDFASGCTIAPLVKTTDRFGNSTEFIYNAGLLQSVNFSSGRWISISYNSQNLVSNVSDSSGRSVSYAYDTSKHLQTVTYPDSTTEKYTYTSNGQMQTIQDRRGTLILTNTYDGNGRIHQQTNPDGTSTFDYTLDGGGNVTATNLTDPRGNIERIVFDSAGYPTSKTWAYGTPLAKTVSYVRGQDELITATTDALGRTTNTAYDPFGDVLTQTYLAGTANAVAYNYTYTNDYHQVATATDPLGHTVTTSYTNGCVTSITDALSHSTIMTCNSAGQRTAIQDALGHTTSLTYTDSDLTSVTDPLSRASTFFPDDLGRTVATLDPLSRESRVVYDVNGRVSQSFDSFGRATSLLYDGNGNLTKVTDPNNGVTQYGYDPQNRLNSRTDALNHQETWTYDGAGNLATYTDRNGQITQYQYDALNRISLITYQDGSTVTPTFDLGDRLTSVVDSVSGTINRSYDGFDNLTQEQTPQGTVNYTYDAANRRATMTPGSQAQIVYTFDNANRLTGITQGSSNVTIGYDDANRRTSLTLPNGVVTSYGYDSADELTGLTYKTNSGITLASISYAYDAAGQRTTTTGGFGIETLPISTSGTSTFNLNNEQTVWNGFALAYDLNGDPTSNAATSPTTSYQFDARHRLTTITQGASTIASFQYDTFGRRTQRTVGSTTTSFLYDVQNGVQETQGATTNAILTGLGIDERFARMEAAGMRYFLPDAMNSTVALTDSTQAVQETYSYEPFGEVASTGTSDNPYQYTGRENDGTGLYYYRARYYSPTLKRFISEDAEGLSAGLNVYAYVANNPLSLRDPSGHDGLGALQVAMTNAFCPAGSCLPPPPAPDPCGCENPPPYCNGNVKPGYTEQDGVCSDGASILNGTATQACCVMHDQCYADNKCNASSWGGPIPSSCQGCNAKAVACIVIIGAMSGGTGYSPPTPPDPKSQIHEH